jgi:hypothetical protein
MPCLKLHAQVDFDLAFVGDGLLLQYYNEEDNPSTIVNWEKLEKELIEMGMDSAQDQEGWDREMRIAMSLIAIGTKLKNVLFAIKDEVNQNPLRMQVESDDEDDDDAGEEWKRC